MKNILLIFTSLLLFNSACKKDPQINPPMIAQPVIVNLPAPVKIEDSIYPNPCDGNFTIQTNSTTNQTVKMYDVLGKLIFNLTINGTTAIIADSLKQGIYDISITTNTGIINKRLVVVR